MAYFGILVLLRFRACRLHFLCHLAERKAKLDITLKLSCVQAVLLPIRRGIELEKPEFDGPFCKGGMVIEHMVAAPVVMAAPAAVCTVAGVPDISKLRHRLRLPAV